MTIQRLDQEIQAKKDLASRLEQLATITAESLVRNQDLGAILSFEQGKVAFDRTLRLFQDLRQANLDNVPLDTLNNLRTRADSAIALFKRIQDFNPGGMANPAPARDNLIQSIAMEYEGHYQVITPVLAYSIRKGTDFENLEKMARTLVAGIEQSAKSAKEEAEKGLADINDTLEKVRRAAADMGVAQHSFHFKEQSDEHLKKAFWWLLATAALGVLTLGFGAYNIFALLPQITSLTPAQSIQMVVAKLIIFSVLYSAAVWSGRIYKAQWHNYVINKHRQNALSTFEAFVKASSSEQMKDAVLLQTTRAIFSCQPSGFISSADVPDGPQILEMNLSGLKAGVSKRRHNLAMSLLAGAGYTS